MSDMSNELRRLFDYQKFENEETLNKVISDCRLIPPAIEPQELKTARTPVNDQQVVIPIRTPVTDQQGSRIGRYTEHVAKLNDEELEMVNAAGIPGQDPNKLIHISNPVDIIGNMFDPLIPGIRRFIRTDDDNLD